MASDLIDVDWLAAGLEDPALRLVEIDVSPAAYEAGHIPGAVLWDAYADLRDSGYRPVDLAALSRLLSASGIAPNNTVVVYGYAAPLGFWLLKAYGHRDVRMLAGPREQWTDAGHAWNAAAPQPVDGAELDLAEDTSISASRETVAAAIGSAAHVLLDVRAEAEYGGERFWPSGATADAGRAGHIPGAVNVPIDRLRAADGRLKSPAELRAVFAGAGVPADKTVIAYCTIGNRASEAWFALTCLLGYPDVRVYYPSWVDWGKDAETPIES